MKLKGNYSSATSYSVGDVVRLDGVFYHLQHSCPAGTPPTHTKYWGKLEQNISQCAGFILDALEIADTTATATAEAKAAEEVEKYFINDQTLVLKAGEGEEITSYAVTVDDSGDTPELAVEEIVEESDEVEGES